MTIPDDMVEKAAMAFFAAVYDEQIFVWVEEAEATKAAMRDGARAALEAVAPLLIAQAEHRTIAERDQDLRNCHATMKEYAAEIDRLRKRLARK